MLRELEKSLRSTQEVHVNPPDLVHLEHIYPQRPAGEPWPDHATYVHRLGNLTLLDSRLNEQLKNADFAAKKERAYSQSELRITNELLDYDEWTPTQVEQRQAILCQRTLQLWPSELLAQATVPASS